MALWLGCKPYREEFPSFESPKYFPYSLYNSFAIFWYRFLCESVTSISSTDLWLSGPDGFNWLSGGFWLVGLELPFSFSGFEILELFSTTSPVISVWTATETFTGVIVSVALSVTFFVTFSGSFPLPGAVSAPSSSDSYVSSRRKLL